MTTDSDERLPASPLEAEFQKAANEALALIDEQIEIAEKAIAQAVKISEQYGVPFYSGITPLGMGYRPITYDEKFGELDSNRLYALAHTDLPEYEGWQHSDVC